MDTTATLDVTQTATPPSGIFESKLAIRLQGVTKHFGSVKAVAGISLEIPQGQIVALLGANGAGKTTTLDMIEGLTQPDSGSVQILDGTPQQAINAGHLGVIMQSGGLPGDKRVGQMLRLVASTYPQVKDVEKVMSMTDIQDLVRRRISKCSGGEQQRVRLALAMLPDTRVLIMDEPTAGMDPSARRRFWELMRRQAREGVTIIFATHYLAEAEDFAQRIIVMNRGRIVADGTPAEVREHVSRQRFTAVIPSISEGGAVEILDVKGKVAALAADHEWDVSWEGDRLRVSGANLSALGAYVLALPGVHGAELTNASLEEAFSELADAGETGETTIESEK
ncbi:MAG: ABC transporter ATP-binding protein [Actinomycetaceae bacterium]|nr:ABC transporter ATP-binding protein [Actinomycetaceae bacterium]